MSATPPPGHLDAWIQLVAHLLSCLNDVGDKKNALIWFGRLEPYGHLIVPHGCPALELGRAARLNEQWSDAFHWFEQALEWSVRERARPFAAITILELGLLHWRRGQGDDLRHARRRLEESIDLFEKLGMHRHRDQAVRNLKGVCQRPAGGLTERQKQIARLVAAGNTDRQIARLLYLSEKTVARHVHNILVKLSLPNRTALATWASKNGLDPQETGPPNESAGDRT
ncbi:MAG: LuxR C-terminal-related transcriptional regulator [Dehalococcoidia bacterium]